MFLLFEIEKLLHFNKKLEWRETIFCTGVTNARDSLVFSGTRFRPLNPRIWMNLGLTFLQGSSQLRLCSLFSLIHWRHLMLWDSTTVLWIQWRYVAQDPWACSSSVWCFFIAHGWICFWIFVCLCALGVEPCLCLRLLALRVKEESPFITFACFHQTEAKCTYESISNATLYF